MIEFSLIHYFISDVIVKIKNFSNGLVDISNDLGAFVRFKWPKFRF